MTSLHIMLVHKKEKSSLKAKDILGTILSAICLILIFPKAQFSILAWFALVPLLFVLKDQNPSTAFRLGLIAGFIYFLGTIYWIPYTLSVYGKLPAALSWGILFIMVSFLSLYVGGFAWGITCCRDKLLCASPLIVAIWWVSMEYLRTYILTGFPWVLLGYSQTSFLPIIQVAEFTGVYGISFLIVFINAVIADSLYAMVHASDANKNNNYCTLDECKYNLPKGWILVGAVLLLVCFAYGKWQLNKPSPEGTLKVALIQGNIPQDQKWDAKYTEEVFQIYSKLSLQAAHEANPQLIIWPEAATPFYFQSDVQYRQRTLQLAHDCGSFLAFGSPGYKMINKEIRPFNSAYLVSPEGEEIGDYQKIHLVPFGEYVPLKKLFSFAGKLVAQAGNFVSGEKYSLLSLNSTRIGTAICYEIIFPDLVRRFVKNGATLLLNITNDAWFGKTAAPYQHFAMLTMRAVENRRYLARAANTGISGFIDPWGRVVKQGDIFTREYLTGYITPQYGITLYSAMGDVFALTCLFLVVTSMIICYKLRKRGNILCKKN